MYFVKCRRKCRQEGNHWGLWWHGSIEYYVFRTSWYVAAHSVAKCFPQKIRHPTKIYLSSEQRTRCWPEGPLNGKDLIITLILYILGKIGVVDIFCILNKMSFFVPESILVSSYFDLSNLHLKFSEEWFRCWLLCESFTCQMDTFTQICW